MDVNCNHHLQEKSATIRGVVFAITNVEQCSGQLRIVLTIANYAIRLATGFDSSRVKRQRNGHNSVPLTKLKECRDSNPCSQNL